jgi:serine/threonine protein kinase
MQSLDIDEHDGAPVSAYLAGQLLPGDVAAGNRLGVGYRCETWLAWSPALWGPVVVKFPRPHQMQHPRARRSLQREVSALHANLHPGLPRLYEDGTQEAVPYVLLEYVDGVSLDVDIAEQGPVTHDEVALLAVHVLAAVRTVHRRGICHVDIKPDNIVVREGKPVLLDFGSARRIGSLQPPGALIGSPGYAAPELEAGLAVTASSDVYGVGVTLHEALTGQPTFDPALDAADRPAPAPLPPSPVAAVVGAMTTADPGTRPSLDEALATVSDIAAAAGHDLGPRPAGRRDGHERVVLTGSQR